MTTLTATNADGTANVSATNGEITIERKGKKFLWTIVKAYIALKIKEHFEFLDSFDV